MCDNNNLTNIQNIKKKYLKNKFVYPLSINLDIMKNISPRDVLEGFFKSPILSHLLIKDVQHNQFMCICTYSKDQNPK